MQAANFFKQLRDDFNRLRADLAPRRMVVHAVADGRVQVKDVGTGAVYDQQYARLAGFVMAADDEVLVAEIPIIRPDGVVTSTKVVLGKLQRTAPAQFDAGAPLIGQVYPDGDSTSAATTSSNTSNASYVVARSYTTTRIPDGTYDLLVDVSVMIADSVPGGVDLRVLIGPTASGARTITPPNTANAETMVRHVLLFSDVVVAGGVTVQIQYKRNSGSGTALARNPSISILASRKGI